ncbi:hypothetical protein C5167_039225 [Papaver somniferum]|uniref:Uncharacterized protein n=1 Tax=Papaver somniferum TaxID=3469 RepID=A0A4Y7IES1_PAPSO|nr:hypothetical protein C5167_039225 [Papaver somniferum]
MKHDFSLFLALQRRNHRDRRRWTRSSWSVTHSSNTA